MNKKPLTWIEGKAAKQGSPGQKIDLWFYSASVEESDEMIRSYLKEFGFTSLQIIQERILESVFGFVGQEVGPLPPGFVPMQELQEAVSRVIESGGIVGLVDHGTKSELLPYRSY